MVHSIFRVIIMGIVVGAMFFFMPKLVLGIFILLVVVRLLHCGHRSRGCYSYGYGHGYRYDRGCGCGPHGECGPMGRHEYHHGHHYGHGPMHEHMFHWVDKIRNMSEEEFVAFKNDMDKGFGFYGKNSEDYRKCKCGRKEKAENSSDSTDKKEETTK